MEGIIYQEWLDWTQPTPKERQLLILFAGWVWTSI